LPAGQKLTLEPLASTTFTVVPFRAYASFSAPLPFLRCILGVVFCGCVHHRLRFCLGQFHWVKMADFSFAHPCMAHAFLPERLCNPSLRLHLTFPKYTQNVMHTLSDASRSRIGPDTWLQVEQTNRQSPWLLVHKQTLPTKRPPQ
jgi:hypothetical protein